MEIADEAAHRAMTYIAAVSRQGYELRVEEFDAYVRNPERSVSRAGGLDDLLGLSSLKWVFGNTKVEGVLPWLVRLGWVVRTESETVRLSPLGEAVLRSLNEQAAEPDAPVLTILESKDPMAYPLLVGTLAQRGEAMLIDPYFGLEALQHVLTLTDITRLIVGPRAELPALAAALDTVTLPRSFDIRVSDEVHDRFVVPPSGVVDHIGTSLTGAGVRLAVMTTIRPPEADAIRRACEKMWRSAKPLLEAVRAKSETPAEPGFTAVKPTARRRRRQTQEKPPTAS